MPPGWTEWRGIRNVELLRLRSWSSPTASAATSRSLRQRRGGLLDRRAAREGEELHQRLGRRPASRSSSTSRSRRRTAADARAAPRRASSQASRPGGRRATTRPTSPTSRRWMQNTPLLTPSEQAELDQIRIDQLEMLQAVDEAIGGSTTLRDHRHHGAPAQPRRRRRHHRRLLRGQRLALGRAPLRAPRTSPTRSRSARRCSCATRSSRRCRARTTRFALNIDLCADLRRARAARDRSAPTITTGDEPACACSTARSPRAPGAPTS